MERARRRVVIMKSILLQGAIFSFPEGLPAKEYHDYITNWVSPYLYLAYHNTKFKFFFYISGIVFEYLKKNHKECFDVLKTMLIRGQVEILNGTYYDAAPVLQTPQDLARQLEDLSYYIGIHNLSKKNSKGVWITPGTYENNSITTIRAPGYKFLLIDKAFLEPVPPQYELGIVESMGKKLLVFPYDTLSIDTLQDKKFIETVTENIIKDHSGTLEKTYMFLSQYEHEKKEEYFTAIQNMLDYFLLNDVNTHNILPSQVLDLDLPWFTVCRIRSAPYGFDDGNSFFSYILARHESRCLYSRYLYVLKLITAYKESKDKKKIAQREILKAQSHFLYLWYNTRWGIQNNHMRQYMYKTLMGIENLLIPQSAAKKKKQSSITLSAMDYNNNWGDEILASTHDSLIVIEKKHASIELLQRKRRSGWNYQSCYIPYDMPKYAPTSFKENLYTQDMNIRHTYTNILRNQKPSPSYLKYRDFSYNNKASSLICSSSDKQPIKIDKEFVFGRNDIQINYRLNNIHHQITEDTLQLMLMTELNLSFLSTEEAHFAIEVDTTTISTKEITEIKGQSLVLYNHNYKEKMALDMSSKATLVLAPVYGTTDVESASDMYQHHTLFIFSPHNLPSNSYETFNIHMSFSNIK